jgi:hypothetical protein
VTDEIRMLPDRYHDAIEHWRQHNFPDYPKLAEVWPKFFPKDEPFCLCAKVAEDIPDEIEIGEDKGKPKALRRSTCSRRSTRRRRRNSAPSSSTR